MSGKNETALVTGGAGAIGSRLVRRLLHDGFKRVVIVDDLSSGYEWLLPQDQRLEFYKRDIAELSSEWLAAPGAVVFHLAAFFANQNSVDYPEDDLHTNGHGTLRVLRWAAENDAARVVYASAGCSIAGHGLMEPIREDMPVSLHLDTPYQITKALGEFYCNYFNQSVSSVRCRFFNSFGPGEVPGRYRNVIPNFFWLAMNDKPLTITGTGDETRDFIFVDDLVDGLVRCANTPEAGGEAINLGTGHETRVIDLANMIIQLTGSKSEIVYASRRPWDNSVRRQANIDKAKTILSFSPGSDVLKGLEKTMAWFEDNRQIISESLREEL